MIRKKTKSTNIKGNQRKKEIRQHKNGQTYKDVFTESKVIQRNKDTSERPRQQTFGFEKLIMPTYQYEQCALYSL